MSGMMNGAPFWSPPHRHQKSYISRLGTLAEGTVKPELSEMPDLVAAAIRQGLIKRPDPRDTIPVPPPKHGSRAAWRVAVCPECNIRFERHRKCFLKCDRCRLQPKDCRSCGASFKPADRKKVCCSKECSKALQSATFKAKHGSKAPKTAECAICHRIRPIRQAGNSVAKTCSRECADQYRLLRNAERYAK